MLNLPYIQQKLVIAVTKELKETLGTEVSIGKIDIGMLNRIIINEVLLNDCYGKEMLKVTRLSAKFEILPLFEKKVSINNIQLFGFNINLNKSTPQAPPNFQFVLDAFASKDTLQKEKWLDLRINSLLVRRGKLSYDVLSEPETPGKFNVKHIELQNIIATISLKALTNDSLNMYIKRLSFEEHSGFELQKLSLRAVANKQCMKLDNFCIDLPGTSLRTNTVFLEYDSPNAMKNFIDDVRLSGELYSEKTTLKDIASLVPALANFTDPVEIKLKFDGAINRLNCPSFEIKTGDLINIRGEAGFQDLSKGKDAYFFGIVNRLYATEQGMEFLFRNLAGNKKHINSSSVFPPLLMRVGNVSFQGELSGYFNDIVTYGIFHTSIGTLQTDIKISTDQEYKKVAYSGKVKTDKINLGKLLNKQKIFDGISFNLNIDGIHYKNRWPDIKIKGLIAEIGYNKYNYKNIELDGIYTKGGFDGKIALNDANGSALLNGSFNLAQDIPTFNFHAVLDKIRPHELHLNKNYKDTEFSLKIDADFNGNSVDNMIGTITVDSFFFQAPGKFYSLDNFTIKATVQGKEKLLEIASGFMTGTVKGNYSYHTIPVSITDALKKYIPSLSRPDKDDKRKAENDFSFDINIYDTQLLSHVFDIPLEMIAPATIKGYFNDISERVRIEGYFPNLLYGTTRMESGMFLCENLSDRFRCHTRATCYLKKGKTLNLALEGTAKDDKVTASLHWGNNSTTTYSGSLAATTDFFKTVGESPVLKADIRVQPTHVILNDTVWNIRPSSIEIDSGRISVNNFLFEHANQFIRIDGQLTKNIEDTVKIELNDIHLGYVFDIVQFRAVNFQGAASGNVYANQILKSPILNTRLKVKDFTFNNGLLGDMDIYGTWDKEQEGIYLDAYMNEKDIAFTNVKGYIYLPKKKLDLHIQADSTNIKFLQHYMRSISSDMNGRVSGNVHFFGGFKSLNLEGAVIADAAFKVDVLNTSFELKRDSVRLVPDEIHFKNLQVFDPLGHRGRVNGYLRHTNLKNLSYRFQVDADNMLVFNTKESPDYPFYGTIYGTGNVLINGNSSGLNVNVAMRTERNTNFVYVAGINTSATNNQFITFVDKTPRRELPDSLFTMNNLYVDKEEDDTPIDIRLNIQVDATPDAVMKIIIDPIAGDYISGKGNGNIRLDFFNKGDVKMFGNYTIDQGIYKFSLQEIIRKDFIINAGSTLTFNGNPLDAILDIQAAYTVNSVSLNDLGLGENVTQNNAKVNCIMNLSGNLLKPAIKFDLELPNANEEERELVQSAISTDEQMNMQILYLLGVGKFYTYDYANNNGQSSNTMSSVLSSTLSGQLNNMFSQALNLTNWNFGTNLSTGEKGWTDMEFEGMLSGQLLNNRLLVNGNFGYRDNPMANTNFIGDFEIEYLLTKSGEIRLKAYNQTNDRYYTKTTLTTQGIGIVYKKDFNTWRELLLWHVKKKSSAQTNVPPQSTSQKEAKSQKKRGRSK